jgi:hypothetical protein
MTSTKVLTTLGVLFFVAGNETILAQGRDTFAGWFASRAGEALPISTLPKEIPSPEGQLTLYADYSKSSEKSVQLYLVNRTEHRLAFSSQDGDLYTKLEVLTENGIWERAQTHVSATCGNSYHYRSLKPNEFFRFPGYFPSEGQEREVRYRLFRTYALILDDDTDEQQISYKHYKKELQELPIQLVSNSGQGRVLSSNIEAAKHDAFAVPFGTFETVRDIAVGIVTPDTRYSMRSDAVQALGRFATDDSLALLKGFLTDSDRNVPPAAMRGIAKMGMQFEPAEKLYQELLRSDDSSIRRTAIFSLTERPITPDVIKFAKEQLYHDDLYVRVMAMSVISHQCKTDPEIKDFLNAAYDDPEPKIRSVFETVLFPTCIEKDKEGKPRGLRPKESP